MNQWVFKAVVAVAIVFASYATGVQLSIASRKRLEVLDILKRLLLSLKSRVVYHRAPLYEALEIAASGESGELSEMFNTAAKKLRARECDSATAWTEAVTGCGAITDADRASILGMASSLGQLDIRLQEAGIDAIIEYICKTSERLAPAAERDGKMYKSLGMLVGLLICVMLI